MAGLQLEAAGHMFCSTDCISGSCTLLLLCTLKDTVAPAHSSMQPRYYTLFSDLMMLCLSGRTAVCGSR